MPPASAVRSRGARPEAGLEVLGESICPYCGVGCRLRFEGKNQRVLKVRGVESAAANRGGICAKGAQLGPTIDTADRLTRPQLRLGRHDDFRAVDWTPRCATSAKSSSTSCAPTVPTRSPSTAAASSIPRRSTSSPSCSRATLGCNNTDSNSRLCMAAAVAGYRSSLGSDGPPVCYDDIDAADVLLVMGSNMAEAHPVTFERIRTRKQTDPTVQLIVIDPRRTPTAAAADLHIPVAPGGDIALLNAVGRALLDLGAADHAFVRDHTRDFDAYRDFLRGLDVVELSAAAGVAPEDVYRIAQLIQGAKGFLSFYCMGLNQSTVGMWKNNSLINLHLLTGQIGRSGAGPFSLTGQPNAMGGREAGLAFACAARLSHRRGRRPSPRS